MLTHAGQPPTILQQLCALPFQYFSNPRLTNILFPTLIACCYSNQRNREILEQELSCSLLSNFIEVSLSNHGLCADFYFLSLRSTQNKSLNNTLRIYQIFWRFQCEVEIIKLVYRGINHLLVGFVLFCLYK